MSPSWHSQIVNTFHLARERARLCFSSRVRLDSSFGIQKFFRDFGRRASAQRRCLCQKHPWTKITFRARRKTRSGWPGRPFPCRRYRYPIEKTSRRTTNSGRVSLDRTRPMISDRRLRLTVSTLAFPPLDRSHVICNCLLSRVRGKRKRKISR